MDFKREFLEEAAELLTRLERICLELEQHPSATQSIGEAFRIAHTLKGSALSVGFDDFGQLAHRLEDVLDQCRSTDSGGPVRTDELLRYVDLLLTYADGLRRDYKFVLNTPAVMPHRDSNPERPTAHRPPAAHVAAVVAPSRQPPLTPSLPPPKNWDAASSTDQNLYYRAFLHALRTPPEEEDLALIADLSRLAMHGDHLASFAGIVMDSLAHHPVLKDVCRVCLVRRLGYSNHLEVVSSRVNGVENLIAEGYRCFIAPDSSLFKLSVNNFRVFHSAPRIVKGYQDMNRPPQRSIAKVATMGLESGLCLGIFRGGIMSGLLFLNARDELLSKLPDRCLPVLSYLGVLAHRYLVHAATEPLYDELWRHHPEKVRGRAFDAAEIGAELQRLVPLLSPAAGRIEFTVHGSSSLATLVANGHVAHILARLTCAVSARGLMIAAVGGEMLTLGCTFKTSTPPDWHGPAVRAAFREAEALGFKAVSSSGTTVILSTSFDPMVAGLDLDYSV